MKNWFVFLFALLVFITMLPASQPSGGIDITILYDNYRYTPGTTAHWGYACLVEGTEKTILFDTGTKPEVLLHNYKTLNLDPALGELVILSHDHGDHTNGVWTVLEKNSNRKVFIPQSFAAKFKPGIEKAKAEAVAVGEHVQVCKDVYLTGEMGDSIKEHALVIDTKKGLVVITGCSHPGIVSIVKRAVKVGKKKVYLVFGGFHLIRKNEAEVNAIIDEFKKLGVQKVGATHCTGDLAIKRFKEAYGENFVSMGTGKKISLH